MDWSMKFSDVAIIIAACLGPVFAIQIQKFLDRRRESRRRQEKIFQTLIETRSAATSPLHISTINAIPIEFYGKAKNMEAVTNSWRIYHEHFNHRPDSIQNWEDTRKDLYFNLLISMAIYLNYPSDKIQTHRQIHHWEAQQPLEYEEIRVNSPTPHEQIPELEQSPSLKKCGANKSSPLRPPQDRSILPAPTTPYRTIFSDD